ncbi:MAG TPA: AraC family transcriptional regulator [Inquilinus sp.]
MVIQSSLVFCTRGLPKSEQFDAWRSFVAPAVEVDLLGSRMIGFDATHTVWSLGSVTLTAAILPGAGHSRKLRNLTKNPLDHWCLDLRNSGPQPTNNVRTRSEQCRRRLHFRSLARPFETVAEDSHVLSLFIPRDLFGAAAGAIDAVAGEIDDIGVNGILADYLLSLERRLPQIGVDELGSVADATRALVAACLAPTSDRVAEARSIIQSTVLDRARQAIQRNLQSPDLAPDQLCRMVAVSRSRLYRLFEPLGGVTHYIQRQRLLHAHALLSDPDNALTINRVGEEYGFFEPSGFSRAFRKEFGYSPSEARAAAISGFPRSPSPPRNFRAPRSPASPLGEALQSLHA